MRPLHHLLSSLCLAFVFFIFTHSITASLIAFLAGIFIDLDHLIDYWVLKPARPFSVRDFLDAEKYEEQKKWIFLFSHSWELVLMLAVLTVFFKNILLFALVFSVALHLISDTYNLKKENILTPLSYFLLLRAFRGFKKERLKT